ncbi:flagellar biosynthetic protein FliO [Novosphingobium profundi]|uniref:flagellar biosynthetic protein FliO n=1 Tax=Novosphingobium profundi TaxID=1774954 RepID=UPI001BDA5459|nr:flagellar biosynthetic protein FliO [Novosphingobium profundi]MBT0670545.1 flagellar biosynthetic protein FliO [Novosphingobium profundi]
MDFLSILRTLGALLFVLGLLVGGLWAVRRYELRIPSEILPKLAGSLGRPVRERRLELVERLAIDTRRSLVLVRQDGLEFSLVMGPEGLVQLDPAKGLPVPSPVASDPSAAPAGDKEANLA